MKKKVAMLLALIFVLSAVLSTGAATIAKEDWETYFTANADVNRGIIMQPGADESQRNFSWYMPEGTKEFSVSVSTSADMADAVEYTGSTVEDPEGGLVAKVTATDLEAGTTYYYTCNTDDDTSEVYTFSTVDGDSFTAMYVTDIHVTSGGGSGGPGGPGGKPPEKPDGDNKPPKKPDGEDKKPPEGEDPGDPGEGKEPAEEANPGESEESTTKKPKPSGDKKPDDDKDGEDASAPATGEEETTKKKPPEGGHGPGSGGSNSTEQGRVWANVLDQANENAGGLDLILSAGDQGSNGKKKEYVSMVANRLGKSIPFATTIGNHDFGSADYKAFVNVPNQADPVFAAHDVDDYWFVKGDVLFLVMDSNVFDGEGHEAVMKAAIEQNPDCKWRVLMMHHELYSEVMEERVNEMKRAQDFWPQYIDKYEIDLVLSGHTHFFSISNVMYNNETVEKVTPNCTLRDPKGTVYLCSGSINRQRKAENPNYSDNIGVGLADHNGIYYNVIDFSGDKLVVRSYDADKNELFNTLTIEKGSVAPVDEPALGDVSCDGAVTAEDARLALRAAVGLENFAADSVEFVAADYDQDKAITAADARAILRVAVGLAPFDGN